MTPSAQNKDIAGHPYNYFAEYLQDILQIISRLFANHCSDFSDRYSCKTFLNLDIIYGTIKYIKFCPCHAC